MANISNRASDGGTIASLAARQEGLISRRQLEACGVLPGRIVRWAEDGRLHPVFHAVFALGRPAVGPRARMRAAVLACPGAVVSHRSAAVLLGFGEVAPLVVDLIPGKQRGRAIDGIKAHRVPYPALSEQGHVRDIPCTSPARTTVDLAGTYGEDDLGKTVERAATARKLDLPAIDAILASGPRRRGAPCLRRVLTRWRPIAETTEYSTVRSLFEARLLPLIVAARLPLPQVNARVHTAERILEVDLLWEPERFVVEADSRRHHAIEIAFERDRRRDRELLAARYGVLRVTWREVEQEADAVVAVVRGELEQRRTLERDRRLH
jgi:very-short-patch-repair endonuclease